MITLVSIPNSKLVPRGFQKGPGLHWTASLMSDHNQPLRCVIVSTACKITIHLGAGKSACGSFVLPE